MQHLREEARRHYAHVQKGYFTQPGYRHPLEALLDAYDRAHPGMNAYQLKAAQYGILAENLTPVVFEHSPFYFATDLLPGVMDGRPTHTAGGWLFRRNQHLFRDACPDAYDKFACQQALRVHLCCGPYVDTMHFCYPVGNVVRHGLRDAYTRVCAAMDGAQGGALDFLRAAEAGLLAAKRVAQRFAQAATARRDALAAPAQRRNMDRLIKAAENAPWNPAEHFFEGLNALWFCRDVLGPMEGIGNSALGRPDLLLYPLYERDLKSGALTREEAYDLIEQFILLGDMHYDKDTTVWGNSEHELEMGIVLGGCDDLGRPVYNELTRMFLQAHRALKAIYPKLHCRISADAPREYLLDIAEDYASGRSVIGLSNDAAILPALQNDGKTLEDARGYVNTGCWSAIVEGKESCPGGNYFHLITILEQSVYGPEPEYVAAGVHCQPLEGAETFEDVYRIFVKNAVRAMRWRCEAIGTYGPLASQVNPLPLTSAMMDGCLESRKDFTRGGCVYNPNTIDPSGFANAVDALLAIQTICFEKQTVPLAEFLDAVRNNWEGADALLYAVRHCPHFGDQMALSISLSQRLHDDLYEGIQGIPNERGGKFSLNYIVYREFRLMAEKVRATPDGRRDGEMFAMGISPSRYHPADPLPAVVQSVGALDPQKVDVTSLDLQLPLGSMNAERLATILQALTLTGVKHVQLNCVDIDTLRDAQKHPHLHQDIVVRICGFSAKFVALSPAFQEEFIGRALLLGD